MANNTTTTNAFYNTRKEQSDVFDELVRSGKTKTDAACWARCAVDPYHDFPVRPRGVPDGKLTQSVVKCVQKSISISPPTSLAEGETWQALIWNSPFDADRGLDSHWMAIDGGGIFRDDSAVGRLGLVNAQTGHSNENIFPASATFGTVFGSLHSMSAEDAINGKSRLLSLGFELTNVGPELFKSGNLIACRRSIGQPSATQGYLDTNPTVGKVCYVYTGMPENETDMFRTPGAKSWEAKYGAYAVTTPASSDYPMRSLHTTSTPCFYTNQGVNPDTEANGFGYIANNWRQTDRDVSLIHLNGLHADSSFILTMRAYVEMQPTFGSTEIDHIQQTPAEDQAILELVHDIQRRMPPACHVGDNDGGDWFRFISGAARSIVPAVFPQTAAAFKITEPMLASMTARIATKLDDKSKAKVKKTPLAIKK